MANNNEPELNSLLQSLKLTWNTDKFEKETEPVLSTIEPEDMSNATRGSIYNY